jgi:hypothetical protein
LVSDCLNKVWSVLGNLNRLTRMFLAKVISNWSARLNFAGLPKSRIPAITFQHLFKGHTLDTSQPFEIFIF